MDCFDLLATGVNSIEGFHLSCPNKFEDIAIFSVLWSHIHIGWGEQVSVVGMAQHALVVRG